VGGSGGEDAGDAADASAEAESDAGGSGGGGGAAGAAAQDASAGAGGTDGATDGAPDACQDPEVDGMDAPSYDAPEAADAEAPREHWLVRAMVQTEVRTYLTDRDCGNPKLVATGWEHGAISPTGSKAVLLKVASPSWEAPLGLVDLGGPVFNVVDLGVTGTGTIVWISDDQFYYVRGVGGGCAPPSQTQVRIHTLSTAADALILSSGRGYWLAASAPKQMLAYQVEIPNGCWSPNATVRIRNLAAQDDQVLSWSQDGHEDFPFGALADESGFLDQEMLGGPGYSPPSSIHRVGWSGARVTIYQNLPGSIAPEGACGAQGRLPKSGELYCNTSTAVYRLDLQGTPPVTVPCTVEGVQGRVDDVWQGTGGLGADP
jgi:hypothetical protein